MNFFCQNPFLSLIEIKLPLSAFFSIYVSGQITTKRADYR